MLFCDVGNENFDGLRQFCCIMWSFFEFYLGVLRLCLVIRKVVEVVFHEK